MTIEKVARAFLPVMPIIAGKNARTTFLLPLMRNLGSKTFVSIRAIR